MLSPYSTNSYDSENKNTIWSKIVPLVPAGSTVLDVGCSTGSLGAVLKQERDSVVTGIDITAADVRIAQKVLDKAFVFDIENQPLSQLGLQTKSCDVIIFADVLEHMKNPVAVLEKVKPLLKKGGRIIFSIPNMAHMYIRLQLLEGRFRYMETGLLDHTHLHFYDSNEVTRIFSDAGYDMTMFDGTTYDYPDKLLEEKLGKVGLKLTPAFSDIAHKKDAVIFEFVGYVEPAKNTGNVRTKPVGTSSPLDEVTAFLQRVKDTDAVKVKALKQKIKQTESHVSKLEAMLDDANRENAQYRNTPLRRLARKTLRRRR